MTMLIAAAALVVSLGAWDYADKTPSNERAAIGESISLMAFVILLISLATGVAQWIF